MKKNTTKAAFGFGIFMAVIFTLQYLFMDGYSTTAEIIKAVVWGIIIGTLSGVAYWWMLRRFIQSKFVSEGTKIDVKANETILFESPANHFKGIEGVGGKLYLTNMRLIFKSHKFNVQNHELSIELIDIRRVDKSRTFGLVNNGLRVTTSDSSREKFVVQEIDKWIGYLPKNMGNENEVVMKTV